MNDFKIIDTHVHLVRTQDEEREYVPIQGRRARDRYGTPERVSEYMDWLGISNMVLLALIPRQYRSPLVEKAKLLELATPQNREQIRAFSQQIAPFIRDMNEWSCNVGKRFPRLHPFICISDDLGDAQAMVDELILRVSQGAKGVKIHPGMFSFFPGDERYWPMYKKCQELGLPVVSDSGPFPHSAILATHSLHVALHTPTTHIDYGEPKNFSPVLQAFPRLNLVLAHLGSAWWDERVELAQRFTNVYFDTSQGFAAVDRITLNPHRSLAEEDAVRIIRKIGIQRVMFGSDFPPLDHQPQLEQILRLPLTDEEKRLILSENARRIMAIRIV
jgi:predicted TIM-barrel fold metal-dependent hydrolase